MKKCSCLAAIVAVLLMLSACSAPYGYEFYKSGDQYYIHIDKEQLGFPAGESICLWEVKFDNLEEMILDIKTGNFTEGELRNLAVNASLYTSDSEGDLPVCDLEALWEPVLPESTKIVRIWWYGPRYSFELSDAAITGTFPATPGKGTDSLLYEHKQIYELRFKKQMLNIKEYIEMLGWEVSDIQTDPDRNATVCYSNRRGVMHKDLTYSFTVGNATHYVYEAYNLEKSDAVPYDVSMMVIDGENWMFYSFGTPVARPSIEFLSSFGMQEYIAE